MVRKKVDSRVRGLIESCIAKNHRSFFVVIGDHGRDQVVHLHYMLSKAQVAARPSVLWCYKKELGFSSHRQKRMKLLEKQKKKSLASNNPVFEEAVGQESMLDRFLTTTDIRYCYYKESDKILGGTFGMVVLQDFEALTPNLLARTIETVQGGGMVVLLLSELKSLRQLHTLTMDVHARFRSEGAEDGQDIVGRFNERFLLSLADCEHCLVLDDALDVIPLSSYSKDLMTRANVVEPTENHAEWRRSLDDEVADNAVLNALLKLSRTRDQADSVLQMSKLLLDKDLIYTLSLTAGRGRGKSAALGMAISAAIGYGYTHVFLTAPNASNVKTVFEFLLKGLEKLGYEEHQDYEILADPGDPSSILKITVTKHASANSTVHVPVVRQVVQYISPAEAAENRMLLGQAELVVIDEAAAIPLPIVKNLLGPYLVFLSSTIHGYEGTGRSLSLKLIKQLRETQDARRKLREISLEEPIRYSRDDPIEHWLNKLLCLKVPTLKKTVGFCPHPDDCQLYLVNRDTLFSYHEASEDFLGRMMSLLVSSHYKNTPNDLQLMSDAPAHLLFVLLPPLSTIKSSAAGGLPEILVVIQVALEGKISEASVMKSLARGVRAAGDLIPWTISQQFQDFKFPELSGARIVRIATHLEYQRMGYGKKAMQLLELFFGGSFVTPTSKAMPKTEPKDDASTDVVSLKPRQNLPPLLSELSEVLPPMGITYLGVSFGLTQSLLQFWKTKLRFLPVYLRQSPNELTGEYTSILLKVISSDATNNASMLSWLKEFYVDFCGRFKVLLSYPEFRKFSASFALELLHHSVADAASEGGRPFLAFEELRARLTPHDLKRLESYAENRVDYHLVLDLVPLMAEHYFAGRLSLDKSSAVGNGHQSGGGAGSAAALEGRSMLDMSPVQKVILMALGLQRKSLDDVAAELKLDATQTLAIFSKIVKKIYGVYHAIESHQLLKSMKTERVKEADVFKKDLDTVSLNADLKDAEKLGSALLAGHLYQGQEEKHLETSKNIFGNLNLDQYKITDETFDELSKSGKSAAGSLHSVPQRGKSSFKQNSSSTFKDIKGKYKKEQEMKFERRMKKAKK